jgi:NADPH-dependent 2,4-dienoyl-CoA reductase/sulfur reductase-like enzyme
MPDMMEPKPMKTMTPLSPNRRDILMGASAGVVALAAPARLRAAAPKHVVVAGGGFAGATAAKYLKLWGDPSLKVTLIDPKPHHYSCVMSNLVLNRSLKLKNIRFPLTALERYGVDVVGNTVVEVDPAAMTVRLKNDEVVGYDKLVMSGGISFVPPDGWSSKKAPHAWIAGGQTTRLRNRIEAMPAGGTYILTIPPSPYRCPPGPYERACTVAEILQSRGGGRVVVLDANPGIQASKVTFTKAFGQLYPGIIDYRTNVAVTAVDADAGEVHTTSGTFRGDVLNIIAPQRASVLVRRAGAVPKGGNWAPVDPLSYASTLQGFENIHIIGDSQGTGQPKSGHMANAQAKVCADAIVRLLAGQAIDTHTRANAVTTNSACFSPITVDKASWLTAVFAYDLTTHEMRLVPGSLAEAGGWSRANNLWTDTFR